MFLRGSFACWDPEAAEACLLFFDVARNFINCQGNHYAYQSLFTSRRPLGALIHFLCSCTSNVSVSLPRRCPTGRHCNDVITCCLSGSILRAARRLGCGGRLRTGRLRRREVRGGDRCHCLTRCVAARVHVPHATRHLRHVTGRTALCVSKNKQPRCMYMYVQAPTVYIAFFFTFAENSPR